MKTNVIETIIGAIVLGVAVLFLVFAYSNANLRSVSGYEVSARFDRIDGLSVGGDVRISGVKVGSIVDMTLDRESYLAEVTMTIDPDIELPTDTVAIVSSESLLGGKFMALDPGGEIDMIPAGGTIEFTQSTPGFEQLLGQVIYSLQNTGESDN
ncbi:MAG: outer membrane lipid asymmetry maintenance protein MlaD [Inquilinaceae bacterium]